MLIWPEIDQHKVGGILKNQTVYLPASNHPSQHSETCTAYSTTENACLRKLGPRNGKSNGNNCRAEYTASVFQISLSTSSRNNQKPYWT